MTISVSDYQLALTNLRHGKEDNLRLENFGEHYNVPVLNGQVYVTLNKEHIILIPEGRFNSKKHVPLFTSLGGLGDVIFNQQISSNTYMDIEQNEFTPNLDLFLDNEERILASDYIPFNNVALDENNHSENIGLVYELNEDEFYAPFQRRGELSVSHQDLEPDDIRLFRVTGDEDGIYYSLPNQENYMTLEDIEHETGWTPYKLELTPDEIKTRFGHYQTLNANDSPIHTKQSLNQFLDENGLSQKSVVDTSPIFDEENQPTENFINIYELDGETVGLFMNPTGFSLLPATLYEQNNDEWVFNLDDLVDTPYDQLGEEVSPVEFRVANSSVLNFSLVRSLPDALSWLAPKPKYVANLPNEPSPAPEITQNLNKDNLNDAIVSPLTVIGGLGLIISTVGMAVAVSNGFLYEGFYGGILGYIISGTSIGVGFHKSSQDKKKNIDD